MRKGFTLIELLIIIVIIVILTATAVPKFSGDRARNSGSSPQRVSTTSATPGTRSLYKYEDRENGVTCYKIDGYDGISCLKTSTTF